MLTSASTLADVEGAQAHCCASNTFDKIARSTDAAQRPCWKRSAGPLSGLHWGGAAIAEKKLPVFRDGRNRLEGRPSGDRGYAGSGRHRVRALPRHVARNLCDQRQPVLAGRQPVASHNLDRCQHRAGGVARAAGNRSAPLVLLGEKMNRYPLEPKSSRYLRFVGFAILVKILWLIPSTIESLIPPPGIIIRLSRSGSAS